jgi:predicted DCC family thiol-disulfide oxidoreductase YuxK
MRAVDWIMRRARPGSVEPLPCQDETRAERFPAIPEVACMEAMQLVLPDGSTFAGEQAMPHLFARMRGWRWLAGVLRLPVVSWLAPGAYRFIARHRYKISVFLGKAKTRCDIDSKCGNS